MKHEVNQWSLGQMEVSALIGSGQRTIRILAWGGFFLLLVVGHLAFTVRELAKNQGFVPYVVEMNGFGQIRSFGEAERVVSEERLTVLHLRNVVQMMRTVVRDEAMRKWFFVESARYIASSKQMELKYFFTDPERADGLWHRVVVVDTVLRHGPGQTQGSEIWEVTWLEDVLDDASVHRSEWRGLFTVAFEDVTDPGVMTNNPFGFVVLDFSIGMSGETQRFSFGEQDALLGPGGRREGL